jgi:tRNA threonylcarbamoyladenosine biosynthesis protein TsaB
MSTILAIETSTELASAALLQDGKLLARESLGAQTHSDSILPLVQALLAEAGLKLQQCDALAFGVGPGSFTGVRTACGIVQGLAFGADLPVVPVVTLAAMAQACHAEHQAEEVLAILDARMGEVYWARYQLVDGDWRELHAPALSAADQVQTAGKPVACGNGLNAYADYFNDAFKAREFAAAYPLVMPHARHVAALGLRAFSNGHTIAPQEAQPLYLRNKVALTTVEREVRDAEKQAKGTAAVAAKDAA